MSFDRKRASGTDAGIPREHFRLRSTTEKQSRVKRWLIIAAIATINLLALAAFAAYFSGQRLDLIIVVGIIADSVGAVTGLLGVWFFFLSEQLNRTTAINLERTTTTVDELRDQMWQMLETTVSSLIEAQKRDDLELAKMAAQQLQIELEKEKPSSTVSQQALETLVETLNAIETKQRIPSVPFRYPLPETTPYDPIPIEALLEKIAMEFANQPEMTVSELSSHLSTFYAPQHFAAPDWIVILCRLAEWEYVILPSDTEITPETLVHPGRRLGFYLSAAKKRVQALRMQWKS